MKGVEVRRRSGVVTSPRIPAHRASKRASAELRSRDTQVPCRGGPRETASYHSPLDVDHQLLEQLYLVQRVQPWFRNELSRLVKTPKLHFIDSGLLAAMRGHSIARLRADRSLFGALLEGFVIRNLDRAVIDRLIGSRATANWEPIAV
ncbi:MAG TPA: DUF4143 domain-containing protein [Steroidobacteraceae bacterium]|nr:DUF4143 domain-containing protein [Steroidobacteraceae bacterium]